MVPSLWVQISKLRRTVSELNKSHLDHSDGARILDNLNDLRDLNIPTTYIILHPYLLNLF